MTEKEAILGFMMGERIKSSLIAANTLISLVSALPPMDRKGGEQTVSAYLGYIASEVALADRVSPQSEWQAVSKSLERAHVKVDSGISSEATADLTAAISQAVTVSHRTMSDLQEKGLL